MTTKGRYLDVTGITEGALVDEGGSLAIQRFRFSRPCGAIQKSGILLDIIVNTNWPRLLQIPALAIHEIVLE